MLYTTQDFIMLRKSHFSFEVIVKKPINQSFLKDINGDRVREETHTVKKLK